MSLIKVALTFIIVTNFLIGCQSYTVRPDDKVIEGFIRDNDINVIELVKYKEYTAIAFKNDSEIGFYLDQTGNGDFSKHWENIENGKVPKRITGGFSDKYLIECIVDKSILVQIHTYVTKEGTFTRESNQKCFVFPTGSGGIQYFNQSNELIAI